MDAAGIERVLLNTVGGVDTITLNDLSGTGVTDVAADLGFPVGTGTGDGSADTVVVNGTAGPDTVHVTSTGAEVAVSGLAAHLRITGSEGRTRQASRADARRQGHRKRGGGRREPDHPDR